MSVKSKVLPDIDPDVKIPAAVKAAAERAEALYKTPEKPEPQNPENEGVQPQDGEVAPPTPAAPGEAQADPPTPPATPATTPPAEPITPPGNEESWEHRYRSMKGRYDKLEHQNKALLDRISSMENVIATLQSSPPPLSAAELKAEKLITQEEEETYGPEFLDVVGKKAQEVVAQVLAPFKQDLDNVRSHVGNISGRVAQSARDKMLGILDDKVPNWKIINRDRTFLDWLGLPDRFSGVIRHELLKEAFEKNDTSRVLSFFEGFINDEAASAPRQEPAPGAVTKPPLESFAAPGRAKTSAAGPAPEEKPFFTRAQISKFYADAAAGKYRGREEERNRTEREIFSAQAEGRIRG